MPDDEGTSEQEEEEVKDPVDATTGKLPDMIPASQYIATKESLGKKVDRFKTRSASLEEKLKTAVTQEEYDKVKAELEAEKTAHQTTKDTLKTREEQSMAEKKNILITRAGFSKEELDAMSADAINGALRAVDRQKPPEPRLDLGVGTGKGASLQGSPYDLTRQAYSGQG